MRKDACGWEKEWWVCHISHALTDRASVIALDGILTVADCCFLTCRQFSSRLSHFPIVRGTGPQSDPRTPPHLPSPSVSL